MTDNPVRVWLARIAAVFGVVGSLATAPPVVCTGEDLYTLETFRDVGPILDGAANLVELSMLSRSGCPALVPSSAYTRVECPLVDLGFSTAGSTNYPSLPSEDPLSETCVTGVAKAVCIQLTDPNTQVRIVAQVDACESTELSDRADYIRLDVL